MVFSWLGLFLALSVGYARDGDPTADSFDVWVDDWPVVVIVDPWDLDLPAPAPSLLIGDALIDLQAIPTGAPARALGALSLIMRPTAEDRAAVAVEVATRES